MLEWVKTAALSISFPSLRLMSALGQKQTSHRLRVMSALPPKADIIRCTPELAGRAHSIAAERGPVWATILKFQHF